MAAVAISNINKSYGSLHALQDVSLQAPDGAFVVFLGPSAFGKPAFLRSIASLEGINSGATIYITHDQVQAMAMADEIVVLNGGCVKQVWRPHRVLQFDAAGLTLPASG